MIQPQVEQALRDYLAKLSPQQQQQVVTFAQSLARVHGVPGRILVDFGGAIAAEDLDLMTEAIDQGCNEIQPDEW